MQNLFLILRESPVRAWLVVCVFLNVFLIQNTHTNMRARFATMSAMSDQQSFTIDRRWSKDWARTPDGRYFSNKAPGPMLLGFPLFWIMDRVLLNRSSFHDHEERFAQRVRLANVYDIFLSTFLQVLPFAALVGLTVFLLQRLGVSRTALHFTAIAMLFGNTASLFMNTYFGHGMAAMFMVATVLGLLSRRHALTGFFLGWAVLSEYTAALLLLPVLLVAVTYQGKCRARPTTQIVLGGLFPAIVWSWYHWLSFGAPWRIALQYQNPLFRDMLQERHNLWGILRVVPDPHVMYELLFGQSRGLLFTQPWILLIAVLIPMAFFLFPRSARLQACRVASLIALPGLLILLLMNSSFGGWHGGWTPGPRYLSSVLPLFGIVAGLLWDDLPEPMRYVLWSLLAVSVLFAALVLSTTINALPLVPLWPFYIAALLRGSVQVRARFIIFLLLFAWAAWRAWRRRTARAYP